MPEQICEKAEAQLMTTGTRNLLLTGVWILTIVFGYFVNRPNLPSLGMAWSLFAVWSLYALGNIVADMDRREEATDANLSLWKRRILFLGQSNPFRRKTVIFQATLVIGTTMVSAIWLIVPDTIVSQGATLVWIVTMSIMFFICEMGGRREYKNAKTFIGVVRGYSKPKQIAVFVVIGVVIVVWVLMMIS